MRPINYVTRRNTSIKEQEPTSKMNQLLKWLEHNRSIQANMKSNHPFIQKCIKKYQTESVRFLRAFHHTDSKNRRMRKLQLNLFLPNIKKCIQSKNLLLSNNNKPLGRLTKKTVILSVN